MAVFSCLSNELRSGDVFIEGAETYADYRKELLDWESCEPLLNEYCDEVGIPNTAKGFVKHLRNNFIEVADRVDKQFPNIAELVIDEKGNPILKKRSPKQRSRQAIWLAQEIKHRMPERNLLDILCNTHHYAGWAHEFGPITGFDSKIADPIERYILTNFSYGTRMGPTQTEKHVKADVTAHMLSWVNRRHVTPILLDKALTKLINFANTFQIIKAWGTGDWDLIETHWADLMQVALSIRAGKMSSPLLLRKLNNYSRKNRLYRALQELGRVIRTQFLLEYISDVELRETITATTNKVEQYNQLCDWASFGSIELVASNDENEMEKAVKYNDIITNSVILQNIIDMSEIIHQLTQEGADIREDDIAFLSPYLTEHIKRFGDYLIDVHRMPARIINASKTLGFVRWSQAA